MASRTVSVGLEKSRRPKLPCLYVTLKCFCVLSVPPPEHSPPLLYPQASSFYKKLLQPGETYSSAFTAAKAQLVKFQQRVSTRPASLSPSPLSLLTSPSPDLTSVEPLGVVSGCALTQQQCSVGNPSQALSGSGGGSVGALPTPVMMRSLTYAQVTHTS